MQDISIPKSIFFLKILNQVPRGGFDQIDDQNIVFGDQNDQNDRTRKFKGKQYTFHLHTTFMVRPNIPPNLRITAISLYLQGKRHNIISSETGISHGSVSNIIAVWKRGLGETEATALRDLGITMNKAGLNPIQCASGFRMVQLLNRLGVNEDDFESYISDIYKRCSEIGLDSQYIADGTKQLLVLSESVPIWQISDYIASKRSEKAELEESVINLRIEVEQTKTNLQDALNKHEVALRQIEFRALRPRLQRAGIQLNDLELFVKSLEGAKELGYDSQEIVRMLANLNASAALDAELQRTVNDKKLVLERMEEERSKQELILTTNHLAITKFKQLESMGLGLELTILSDTVMEIAMANEVSINSAVRTFLKDINKNYEPHLSLREKCKDAQLKLDEIKRQHLSILAALSSKKKVADVLAQIQTLGFQDQEILEFAYELRPELRPIEPPAPATNSLGGISMDMIMNLWPNLFQNTKLLQSNSATTKNDIQKTQSSPSKPPINPRPGSQSNLQSVWNLQFSNLELISSAGYKTAKTFEKDIKEVKEMCEYSNAVKQGKILAESPVPINIPYQDEMRNTRSL